jgi:hypothetical protein
MTAAHSECYCTGGETFFGLKLAVCTGEFGSAMSAFRTGYVRPAECSSVAGLTKLQRIYLGTNLRQSRLFLRKLTRDGHFV